MGIVTTSSQTTFSQSPEVIYDFITNPANWTKTYPGSTHIKGLPDTLPLKVGDVWTEAGIDGGRIFTWQLALATPPLLWMFSSVGWLGHYSDGNGGMTGRISVEYQLTRPGGDVTLFTRTMTVEAYKDSPLPDDFFRTVNPANIDRYHAAIARELNA